MKKDLSSQHTFAVCAYKESAYLRACLESLRNQTVKSRIVLATSTPSDFLRNLAEEFRIDYRVNPEQGRGIAADWNFALSCAETAYCTIAHQDDLYLPDYAERVVRALARHQDSLIAFTDYADRVMPEDVVRGDRFYLWIKRFLLLPFYGKHAVGSRFFKEWSLRFGNAICCPAVTYHLSNLPGLRFDEEFTVNLDWAMWLTLAARRGTFVYLPERLMQHRISDAMETSSAIADRRRYREDQKIFDALWPRPIARLLMHFYAKNYEGDRL